MSTKFNNRISQSNSRNQSENGIPYNHNVTSNRDLKPRRLTSPIQSNHTYLGLDDIQSPEWDISTWPSKWKRFELLNRGIYNGKWADKKMKRSEDDWYLCRNIGGKVGLSESMKETLWQVFCPLDMRSFDGFENKGKPDYTIRPNRRNDSLTTIYPVMKAFRKQYLVVFSICALLYNQNMSDHQQRYYPGTEPDSRDRYGVQCRYVRNLIDDELKDSNELLDQFADNLGFRDEDIRSCMEKLRQDCPRLE